MAVLLNGAGNSSERVKGMMSTNLVFIGLMLVGRLLQKKRNKAVDAVDEGNHGRLLYHEQNGFLVFSALPLFFLGFICWNMDKNGTWCNPRSWWQGHAIWHLFTCMALIVLYYFYRLERIVRVVQPWSCTYSYWCFSSRRGTSCVSSSGIRPLLRLPPRNRVALVVYPSWCRSQFLIMWRRFKRMLSNIVFPWDSSYSLRILFT